jgi:signal transduction histidine kinase/CheY-like chemotaxis protein/tetratricopeptide (TPR) repeat protein
LASAPCLLLLGALATGISSAAAPEGGHEVSPPASEASAELTTLTKEDGEGGAEAPLDYEALIAKAKAVMMTAPAEAFAAAEKSYALAAEGLAEDPAEAMATALWLKAEAALRSGRAEEGDEAAKLGLSLIADRPNLGMLVADLTLARGRLAGLAGNIDLAVRSYYEAHDFYVELGDARKESLTLQSLGSVHRDAKSFDKALEFFERAAAVYDGDEIVRLSITNNVGNILRDTGRYDEAVARFEEAVGIAEEMGSDILVARVLTNLAQLELRRGSFERMETVLKRAYSLLEGEEGAHWRRFVHGAEAELALAKGDQARALSALKVGFEGIEPSSTNMAFREMHETAAKAYDRAGLHRLAFQHLTQFKRLSDEATSLAASANLALLGAEFQFAEQELDIARLENQSQLAMAELSAAQANQRSLRAIIASGGLFLLAAGVMGAAIFRNQRKIARINGDLSETVSRLSEEIDAREQVENDLIVARDKAEDADRMKSVFLATMSHELRTPMNGILGFTEVLLSGDLTEEQREQIEIIDQSSGSLLTLINDILDISQLEAGKFKLRQSTFDLRVTAFNAVKLLRAKALEKHLSLIVDVEEDIPAEVYGDEDRLRQIILNLVGNAVKFTEQGCVVLRVMLGEAEGEIRFEVHDSGIGIRRDKLASLFDRFSQVDGSHTRKHAGSGLGLAISKELTQAMGGGIGCVSEPGLGSTFFFTARLIAEGAPASQPITQRYAGRRVALLDPLDLRRDAVARIAARSGAEVLTRPKTSDLEQADLILIGGDGTSCSAKDASLVIRSGAESRRVLGYGVQHREAAACIGGVLDPLITNPVLGKAMNAVLLGEEESTKERKTVSAMRSGSAAAKREDLTGRKVLIVDDVAANRKLVECILQQFGVTCVLAENGQAAVEAAQHEGFGIILMDVFMPVMGGLEAARAIKSSRGLNASTPIFALTASPSASERQEALAAGMTGVLTKPINIAKLRQVVADTLTGRLDAEACLADEV